MRFADNRNKIGKYIPALYSDFYIRNGFVVYLFSETRLQLFRKKDNLQKFPEVNSRKNCFR